MFGIKKLKTKVEQLTKRIERLEFERDCKGEKFIVISEKDESINNSFLYEHPSYRHWHVRYMHNGEIVECNTNLLSSIILRYLIRGDYVEFYHSSIHIGFNPDYIFTVIDGKFVPISRDLYEKAYPERFNTNSATTF